MVKNKILIVTSDSRVNERWSSIAVMLIVFLLSCYISPYYIYGDQYLYRILYEGVSDFSLIDGYFWYINQIQSKELVHYFLIWVASHFIEKDIFVAISNGVLAYVSMRLFLRWGASVPIAAFLVVFGYYHIGFYFTAERLKFGVLFLALSLLHIKNTKMFLILSFLSIVSHIQVLIIYAALLFKSFIRQSSKVVLKGMVEPYSVLLMLLMFVPVVVMHEQIIVKFQAYHASYGIDELVRIIAFLLLSLWYSKNKYETCIIFTVLIVAVFLLGGMRINLFGYFAFLYYALPTKNGKNVGVIGTAIYFFVGTLGYVFNILEYGVNTPQH